MKDDCRKVGANFGAIEKLLILNRFFGYPCILERRAMKISAVALIVIAICACIFGEAAAGENLMYSILFPGWGQTRVGHYGRAVIFAGGEVLSLIVLAASDLQYDRNVEQYERAKALYLRANYIGDALEQYRIMNEKWDSAEDLNLYRNIALGTAIGVWLMNIVDMILDDEAASLPIVLRAEKKEFAVGVSIPF